MKTDPVILVLVTAPDLETARTIARGLVEKQLAACVSIVPGLESIYHWEGEIQQDQEVLLLIKTREDHFQSRVIPLIKEFHPYQLPEILSLPIKAGEQEYLAWIREARGKNSASDQPD